MKLLNSGAAKFVAGIGAMATLLAPQLARADYKYEYTSNPFPVTWTALFDPDLPPVVVDTTLSAVIFSPTPLVAGSGLSSGLSFTLTQSSPLFVTETLVYPYPYPPLVDGCGPGTPCYPDNVGVFSIGAVDAAGLPTDWNVGINFSYRAPTGREYLRYLQSSTSFDSVTGWYEGFSTIQGSLSNNPGVWTVTAVPEPETYVLLLAGLGLLGFVARRGNSQGKRGIKPSA